MTITFDDHVTDRRRDDWESALLAAAVRENTELDPLQHRRLLRVWLPGLFNAAASGLDADGRGTPGGGGFQWLPAGPGQYQLVWHAPYGVSMVLAKVYGQENGSYAAVVVAGVKDDPAEAMHAAQWAIARLSSE
jgi:hypothetical protein